MYQSLKLMIIALVLTSFVGCSLSDYKLSEDGKTIHSEITGVDYPVAKMIAKITKKYSDEEIAEMLGQGKESLTRVKRYRNGTFKLEDIKGSMGVLIQLYIKVK